MSLPDLEIFNCKICAGDPETARPIHTKYMHYAVGGITQPIECEWIIDPKWTALHDVIGNSFAQVCDEMFPWTLEKCTEWFNEKGFTVVWMRRERRM